MRKLIIAIDFDGTIVEHRFPNIGEDLPYAKAVINKLASKGHHLFLYTMRDGEHLQNAINYLRENEINIQLFNESPAKWSMSPKLYANIYIDDAALGCPVNSQGVDWKTIAKWFHGGGIFTTQDMYELFNGTI